MYYHPDFYRQSHRERVDAMRMDYQRAEARPRSTAFARFKRYARSVSSRARSPRRAPAFRA